MFLTVKTRNIRNQQYSIAKVLIFELNNKPFHKNIVDYVKKLTLEFEVVNFMGFSANSILQ